MQRFWDKVNPPDERGCLLWRAAIGSAGYGNFYWQGRTIGAHQAAWLLAGHELPSAEATLDHRCGVRRCVNVEHLRVLSRAENVLIGDGITARNARKTHCQRGHAFDEANTYGGRGHRDCRACHRERAARRRARRVDSES